ncbi:MAG: hypothetical protein ACI8RD_012285 [Bacillariaceae sp.]|jgi:hypothetical protein
MLSIEYFLFDTTFFVLCAVQLHYVMVRVLHRLANAAMVLLCSLVTLFVVLNVMFRL